MKQRITTIVFIVLLIASLVWLLIIGSKPEVLPISNLMPRFKIITPSGEKIIENSKNKTLIVYFSEECPHCIYELNVLNNNLEKLNGVKIYLLTISENLFNNNFINEYPNLLTSENVTFGIIDEKEYETKFGSDVTPTLYFFDGEGKLTAKLKGETKIERIFEEFNKQSFRNPGNSADVRNGKTRL